MLLIAATRYFTGRMTIATCAFADELGKAWPEIPEETRNIIKRDLEDEFRRDDEARARGDQHKPLGMDCDRAGWEKVRAIWSNEKTYELNPSVGCEMPRYKCHKEVHALKIAALMPDSTIAQREGRETTGGLWIEPADVGQTFDGGSLQRVGRRHQPWAVAKPRASGMWWWWDLDPEHEPEMVEVRYDQTLRWMGLGPTMHWPGLTRVRNVMAVGGVWAGPVKPPETPGAAVPPTDEAQQRAGGQAQ